MTTSLKLEQGSFFGSEVKPLNWRDNLRRVFMSLARMEGAAWGMDQLSILAGTIGIPWDDHADVNNLNTDRGYGAIDEDNEWTETSAWETSIARAILQFTPDLIYCWPNHCERVGGIDNSYFFRANGDVEWDPVRGGVFVKEDHVKALGFKVYVFAANPAVPDEK